MCHDGYKFTQINIIIIIKLSTLKGTKVQTLQITKQHNKYVWPILYQATGLRGGQAGKFCIRQGAEPQGLGLAGRFEPTTSAGLRAK